MIFNDLFPKDSLNDLDIAEEAFKSDRKTIRSWGLAILSRDPEHLARVLLGRGVNQKRTPAIDPHTTHTTHHTGTAEETKELTRKKQISVRINDLP